MDRKRVFKLLAMGRISAAEAERLMAAWQASRESSWILIGCIGVVLVAQLNMGALPVIQHLVHTVQVSGWMHRVAATVLQIGGTR
jgi:hypothetical protein